MMIEAVAPLIKSYSLLFWLTRINTVLLISNCVK
jgi:hypothetical protein